MLVVRTRIATGVAAIAGIAWPVLSHAAALAGRSEWMPAITAGSAAIVALAMMLAAGDVRIRMLWAVALAALALVFAFAPWLLVYLPPVAINLAFGAWFASTLRPGREPCIARFARLAHGGTLPTDVASYARGLTWVWTALFFGLAVVGLVLAIFAPLVVWSTFTNLVSYALVAALFVGEHVWRRVRFAQQGHVPIGELVRIVVRDGRLPRP
jgi:uncharacterized membrane protein